MSDKKKRPDRRVVKLGGYGPREVIRDICAFNKKGPELTIAQAGAAFGILSDMFTSEKYSGKLSLALIRNGMERRRKKRSVV